MSRRNLNGYVSTNWGGGNSIEIENYLTIVALENGLTAQLSLNACEYCVDGDGNWKTLSADTNTEAINKGHTLSFRGNLTPTTNQGIGTFTISKSCNLEGNCMSMLFGDEAADNNSLERKDYAFYELFYHCTTIKSVYSRFLPATTLSIQCCRKMFDGCTSLTQAPSLPAMTLAEDCYYQMFEGCTSLTQAPELPATTLAYGCYNRMFYGCNGLTTTPELPATTLAEYCYGYMFRDCTSLTTTPSILPATTLANNCYYHMFYGCSNLTTSPELPATTLKNFCYSSMFYGCTCLTQAPELPAMTLSQSCYSSMFRNCTSLTTAPELPATTLANYCYSSMFYGCNSLTTTPELPAIAIAEYCYSSMFQGCTNLTTAPTLPATDLKLCCYQSMFRDCTSLTTSPKLPAISLKFSNHCYEYMFYNCSKLNYIKAMFTTTPTTTYTNSWVSGVASTGTFVKNPNATWSVIGINGIPEGWTIRIDVNNYLTIVALEDGLTASLSTNACEYCVDGDNNWKSLPAATNTETINTGQTLSFRGNLTPATNQGIGTFTISKSCNLEGNCMSMLFGNDAAYNTSLSGKDYAFCNLFYNCTTIKSVSSGFLPATTLANSCYKYMFRSCTSLTQAPELPATTLENYCYYYMFENCNITTSPILPATTLKNQCYSYMFERCSKLNYIKAMFTTTPSTTYTDYWVYDVASTGTFVKNKNATWNVTGVNGIPSGWTVKDNVTITKCKTLTISAEDVSGQYTTTNVSWVAICDAVDDGGNTVEVRETGTFESEPFPQNTSTTETITRTISFTYMGVTASTTFVHGIYIANKYTVNLNNQWRLSSNISNPNSSLYDGVYESYSNYNISSGTATMTINITGYTSFSVYIRSYAESNYDYVMISQLDKTITGSTSYSSSDVKAHTRGSQQSGTAISNYKLVEYTNIDGGDHTITIVYRKDSSANSGDDRGYVLIKK